VLRAANQTSSWREVLQLATLAANERKVHVAVPPLNLPIDVVLVRLSVLVQSIYADVSAQHDLSPAQAQLICVIKDQPRGMTELTHILGLERPGLSGLVDRVQRRGLLQRDPVQHDRRAVMLSLTPHGKSLAEQFYGEVSDRLTQIVADLPLTQQRQLEAIGTRILTDRCVPPVFGDTASDPARS
jgi:DNA-binding MarR family transcriptional regulator